jgi:hypothetical protein
MSRQAEIFDRAAECDRLMNRETDEVKRTALRLVKEMWIALANESVGMPSAVLTREIAAIDEIQNGLLDGKNRLQ